MTKHEPFKNKGKNPMTKFQFKRFLKVYKNFFEKREKITKLLVGKYSLENKKIKSLFIPFDSDSPIVEEEEVLQKKEEKKTYMDTFMKYQYNEEPIREEDMEMYNGTIDELSNDQEIHLPTDQEPVCVWSEIEKLNNNPSTDDSDNSESDTDTYQEPVRMIDSNGKCSSSRYDSMHLSHFSFDQPFFNFDSMPFESGTGSWEESDSINHDFLSEIKENSITTHYTFQENPRKKRINTTPGQLITLNGINDIIELVLEEFNLPQKSED